MKGVGGGEEGGQGGAVSEGGQRESQGRERTGEHLPWIGEMAA